MIDHVNLGSDLESIVARLATSERFGSVDAVLRESVRLLEMRERKLAELDAALEEGLIDLRAGRLVEIDVAFDRVEAKLTAAIGTM